MGFVQVEYVGTTGITTSKFTVGAMFRAYKAEGRRAMKEAPKHG